MADRLVVIDIDPGHGGEEAWYELRRLHGDVPDTVQVVSGAGGTHLYFTVPDGVVVRNSAGHLGPGIDVRGRGGYVVAPPSMHVSGEKYAWEVSSHPDDVPVAPIPEWLLGLLLGRRQGTAAIPAEEWRALVADGSTPGGRNTAATRLAGHLLRRWIDPVVTLELVQAWNAYKCKPPLPADEVDRIVDSVCRKELNRRQAAGG